MTRKTSNTYEGFITHLFERKIFAAKISCCILEKLVIIFARKWNKFNIKTVTGEKNPG